MLCLLMASFRVWLQAKTRKFHKSFKALPCSCYTKIKYSALGLDGNIAIGFASCYISILAMCLVLYFTYITRSNALTYTYSSIYHCMCTQVSLLFVTFILINSAVLDALFFTAMLVIGRITNTLPKG